MSTTIVVVKKTGKDDEGKTIIIGEAAVEYDFGETLSQAIDIHGEDVVFSNYKSRGVVAAQAAVRPWIEQQKTQDEIIPLFAEWKLGVAAARSGVSAEDAFLAKWAKMTPDAQAEILKKLKK